MQASGIFAVEAFVPFDPPLHTGPETGAPVGVATMEKRFSGEIAGDSTTVFTYALDPVSSVGAYVAMESFTGKLHERTGTFNFMHSATTAGEDRSDESCTIVPSSGTAELKGISGGGSIIVDADGTHHLWLEYRIAE